MTGQLDDMEIDINCQCGHNTPKTIGWLKQNDTLTCQCGNVINIDASDLDAEIGQADESITGLRRTIDRNSKN